MCTHCTRRQFIGADAVGGMALTLGHLKAAKDASSPTTEPDSKVRICLVMAGKPVGKS